MLWFVSAAWGFCGAYVGEAGAELSSAVGEVAIVRQGTRTTLTVSNDFRANVGQFAMLIPVPKVLAPEDVRVVDPDVFDRLDVYSGPRLVTYTCDELYPPVPPQPAASGCGSESYFVDSEEESFDAGYVDDDVEVEARFVVGEYEIVILDATESRALLGWLGANGFAVAADQQALLQAYLDGGSYFFAARVDVARLAPDQSALSPISFGYDSEAFQLPIRLGTGNSPGSQDVVVYAITDPDEGRVGISNYPERTVEDECLYVGEPASFGAFYEAGWAAGAPPSDQEPAWVAEYGWNVTPNGLACDPCPPTETQVPLPFADLVALGFVGEGAWFGEGGSSNDSASDSGGGRSLGAAAYYFTRLRMRYTPTQASQDLSLYASRITDNTQQRYIQHAHALEDAFPVCGTGWVPREQAGSCADESEEMAERVRYWREQRSPAAPGRGCDHRGGAALGLVALGAALAGRRRASLGA